MSRCRILVVDDDGAVRRLTVATLVAEGYDIVESAHGREAIARARDDRPDLVVLDNSMPDMTGRDVARSLRDDRETAHIPILMLSALASDEDQWEGWRAGVDLYMTKPFEPDELVGEVQRLLAERGPRLYAR